MNSSTSSFVDPLRTQLITQSDYFGPLLASSLYQGSYIEDTLCFASNCLEQAQFLGIMEGEAIPEGFGQGILGLGLSSGNHSLIKRLKEASLIDN